MIEPRQLADLFRVQELVCRGLGSPLWADMCARLAADATRGGPTYTQLGPHARADIDDAFPLRVLGGLHRMALAGDAPELAALLPSTGGDGDADAVFRTIHAYVGEPPIPLLDALTRPPQTNEVGRSAALVGGFLVVAADTRLPLRVLEIGTSAGLNLRFDHFRYEQGTTGFGPEGSPVRFAGFWPSAIPPFDTPMTVASRRGCDLDPIDVATADGRLTLLSYVWPDQLERFERTASAIDVASRVRAVLDRADAPDWLEQQLAASVEGNATVVFHSIMWQYLGDATRDAVRRALTAAGTRASADAPLAWLRLEPDEDLVVPRLRLTTWPGGDERVLAECSFHLGPVEWMG